MPREAFFYLGFHTIVLLQYINAFMLIQGEITHQSCQKREIGLHLCFFLLRFAGPWVLQALLWADSIHQPGRKPTQQNKHRSFLPDWGVDLVQCKIHKCQSWWKRQYEWYWWAAEGLQLFASVHLLHQHSFNVQIHSHYVCSFKLR